MLLVATRKPCLKGYKWYYGFVGIVNLCRFCGIILLVGEFFVLEHFYFPYKSNVCKKFLEYFQKHN